MDNLLDALMVELAYCRQADKPVSETATRIEALVTRRHVSWGAGDPDCPKDIKAGNGELHTLRCKVCGQDISRANEICLGRSDHD